MEDNDLLSLYSWYHACSTVGIKIKKMDIGHLTSVALFLGGLAAFTPHRLTAAPCPEPRYPLHTPTVWYVGGNLGSGQQTYRLSTLSNQPIHPLCFQENGQVFLKHLNNPSQAYAIRWFSQDYDLVDSPPPTSTPSPPTTTETERFEGKSQCYTCSGFGYAEINPSFRIGLGCKLIKQYLAKLSSTQITYTCPSGYHYQIIPSVTAGWIVLRYPSHTLALEIDLGANLTYGPEARTLINFVDSPYVSLKASWTYRLSEYISLSGSIVRDVQEGYEFMVMEDDKCLGVFRLQKGWEIQLGLHFSPPRATPCRVSGCRIVHPHMHGGHAYRGAPITQSTDKHGRLIRSDSYAQYLPQRE